MMIKSYWLCPHCGSTKVAREKRPNGDDRCQKCLMKWPSKETVNLIPESDHIKEVERLKGIIKELFSEYSGNMDRDLYMACALIMDEPPGDV